MDVMESSGKNLEENTKQKESKSKATHSYTGLCSEADRKSPRPMNINPEDIGKDQLKETVPLAQQLLVGLQHAITKGGPTISTLRDMANELDKVQKDGNIAKVTDSSTAVAADTGLDASPSVALAELSISNDSKMEEAQKVLEEYKAVLGSIDENYTELARLAEKISEKIPGTSKEILCLLLVGIKLQSTGTNGSSKLEVVDQVTNVLIAVSAAFFRTTSKQSRKIVAGLDPKLTNVFSEGVVESAGRVARTVLPGLATVASPGFSIYEMVKVSMDINNGSKSTAAESLRKIAERFLEQVKEMEELLEELRKQSEELGKLLKEEFQKLLKVIAQRGKALEEEVVQVWRYMHLCQPSNAWAQAFMENVTNPQMYMSHIARIWRVITQKIEEYLHDGWVGGVIDLTFIAHGRIMNAHGQIMNPLHPCSLNYFNESVESIKLYEPWGCAVNANVAYGIATGAINIRNVHYSDQIVLPDYPSDWNTLPRDSTLVPMVVFSHVNTDEGVYIELCRIAREIGLQYRGLVIPYFQPPGVTNLPEIPLWALSNVVAIAGFLLNKRFKIHVAACLSTDDESIMTRDHYPSQEWPTVACRQYRTVQVNRDEPVFMSCALLNNPDPALADLLSELL